MFGLGVWEVILILVTALVVLGPQKLPQVARQLARLLGELKRISEEVRRNVDEVLAEPEAAATPRTPEAKGDKPATHPGSPPRLPAGVHAADPASQPARPSAPQAAAEPETERPNAGQP